MDSVVALLSDDAWLAMPPAPHEYLGHAAIEGFLRTSIRWRRSRRLELVPTRANGQPAFACYLSSRDGSSAYSTGVLVLAMSGDGSAASPASSMPTYPNSSDWLSRNW
ncbi:MAG: hypothetical protein LC799_02070 [Actinobacteria bacterium]|nr:hypothetical protein [Actinomycetota bacterium]